MKFLKVNKMDNIPKYSAICMFADFEISNNAANIIDHKLNIISKLKETYPNYRMHFDDSKIIADCLETIVDDHTVFCLIIGPSRNYSVTHTDLQVALHKLRNKCMDSNIENIVVYTDGLDSLNRTIRIPICIEHDIYPKTLSVESNVNDAIEYAFEDTNINVVCCNPA